MKLYIHTDEAFWRFLAKKMKLNLSFSNDSFYDENGIIPFQLSNWPFILFINNWFINNKLFINYGNNSRIKLTELENLVCKFVRNLGNEIIKNTCFVNNQLESWNGIIYLDESGFDLSMKKEYGWKTRGQRLYDNKKGQRKYLKRITVISAYSNNTKFHL